MPASGFAWKNCDSRLGSTPGTGTCAMKRKITRMTPVKISFRRRSGRFQALARALSIVPDGGVGGRVEAAASLRLALLRRHVHFAALLAVRDGHVGGVDPMA